jgi:hypothetical protein
MPRIFDFGGRDVERSQTVAGLRALKGAGQRVARNAAHSSGLRRLEAKKCLWPSKTCFFPPKTPPKPEEIGPLKRRFPSAK